MAYTAPTFTTTAIVNGKTLNATPEEVYTIKYKEL